MQRTIVGCLALVSIAFHPAPTALCAANPAVAIVTVDAARAEQVSQRPLAGRLFLFLSQKPDGEPRMGPDWFAPEPFFARDVADVSPGDECPIDDAADGFPARLSRLPAGEYRAQAILDHEFYSHHPAHGVGNLYSQVATWRHDPLAPNPLRLTLDQVVEAQPFPESQWVKEVIVSSRLLATFHGHEVLERASVVLPANYESEPERRYPVIYSIPGFGGSHRDALRYAAKPPESQAGETEFIRVALSADCKWGHHVYADGATNGPRGAALIEEMIPEIDRRFRTVAAAAGRFVTGHSSGGWSSLWLQVNYPDTFGGVWSTSPDPVDFRDYQQVDLYARPPLSLYVDDRGLRRPIARRGDQPVLWYDDFAKMDDCLGRGGQLRSFEAAFSPLDASGAPQKLWDRCTGRIDPQVAKAWEKYDIRLVIERNWAMLQPKLQGKLHIVTGELDTFYLEGAVRRLAETLKQLGSDAEVTIEPGKNHSNILTAELAGQIRRQMTESYIRSAAP